MGRKKELTHGAVGKTQYLLAENGKPTTPLWMVEDSSHSLVWQGILGL